MSLNSLLMIIVFIWLFLLSVLTFWIFRFFRQLSRKINKSNLVKLLENIIEREELNSKDITELKNAIDEIKKDARGHVQKVALFRFNPFEELGGDQSFSLAVLDGKSNGFILTGLHTRERTRVYVKNIVDGKSEFSLSKEEQKVLKSARGK